MGEFEVKGKDFVVGDRVYQLIVIGTKEDINSKDTGKVLGSFKVLK